MLGGIGAKNAALPQSLIAGTFVSRSRSSRAPVSSRTALAEAVREAYPHGVEAVVSVVDAALTAVLERVTALEGEVATLRTRLAADSTTSSKPPSTDVSRSARAAIRTTSLRERSGRRQGAQPGHRGETLPWRDHPETVVSHRPVCCELCGGSLGPWLPASMAERAQVIDLPRIMLTATEHQRFSVACPHCG